MATLQADCLLCTQCADPCPLHAQAQVLEEEAKRHCQGVHGGAGLLAGQQQDTRWAEVPIPAQMLHTTKRCA